MHKIADLDEVES